MVTAWLALIDYISQGVHSLHYLGITLLALEYASASNSVTCAVLLIPMQIYSQFLYENMLKILQARLQQYMNRELLQARFGKGRETRDQIASIHWIIYKAREFQKNIYFCFIDYAKAFDYVDHNKLWKVFKEMGIRDHLTCLF